MEEIRKHIKFWLENNVTRPLGRPKYRWEDNTKLDHTEIGCEDMKQTELAPGSVKWCASAMMVMTLWVI
jgi:hypothetical protein